MHMFDVCMCVGCRTVVCVCARRARAICHSHATGLGLNTHTHTHGKRTACLLCVYWMRAIKMGGVWSVLTEIAFMADVMCKRDGFIVSLHLSVIAVRMGHKI